ncbi:MAG: chromosome partitioning protein ParA [Acidobacteria bacterium CG_4_9_14_3_um_filter_49_7]|nr:MAG: chromosome partitioning protein ParA [Acidobacteria bacterium CG_4_9_14_3_um_filter_49_7]
MSENSCSTGSCGMNQNPEQIARQRQVERTLGGIKHKIVVLSGKGGVGKSTVAASIATKLAVEGHRVGILDVDIHGPSVPRIFGVKNERPGMTDEEKMIPVPMTDNLKLMSVGFLLPNDKEALIWRGPLKIGLIEQFFSDVDWGELDYLVVDCPPGTGDEPLSILQMIPNARGIIVTTPQGLAVEDVQKSITFCKKMNLDLLGIVENMSSFQCPHCAESIEIFPGKGGEMMAKDAGVPLLAKLPLNHKLMEASDNGKLMQAFKEMSSFDPIVKVLSELEEMQPAKKEAGTMAASATQMPRKDDRIQTIAMPVDANNVLDAHFGHASGFAFFVVDTQKKIVVEKKTLTPPAHEPGVIPTWIAAQGTHTLLTGGLGESARKILVDKGVDVVVGVSSDNAEKIAKDYLNNTLNIAGNQCNH